MDSDKPIYPPQVDWYYDREMTIEDVDVWEVLAEGSGGIGVYAAWCPYAEFYMVCTGMYDRGPNDYVNPRKIETYYGPGAQKQVFQRARELGFSLETYKIWVDDQDLWLYQQPQPQLDKKIILP
jgi:hypothetical protein